VIDAPVALEWRALFRLIAPQFLFPLSVQEQLPEDHLAHS